MRRGYFILMALAVAGLYVADQLVIVFIRGQMGVGDQGLCVAHPGFSCAEVARSVYSQIAGVPNAVLAQGFYLTLLISALALRFGKIKNLHDALFASGLLALLYALFLGTISHLVIKKLCPYCMMLYGVNLGLFITLSFFHPKGFKRAFGRLLRVFSAQGTWFMAALMLLGSGGSYGLYRLRFNRSEAQMKEHHRQMAERMKPTHFKLETGDAPFRGSQEALVEVVEFSDFQCPYCSRLAKSFKEIQAEEPGLFRYTFKQLPMSFHKHARGAAKAHLCAGRQGKFWEMHDLLFQNQKKLNPKQLEGYALSLGVDMESFIHCLKDPQIEEQIQREEAEAKALGATGTPTYFVNGWRQLGATSKDKLIGILRKARRDRRKEKKATP